MGKKSKRHQAQGGAQKTAPGAVINNKAVCRAVDELWARTQSPASQSIATQWQEYENTCALIKVLRDKQGVSLLKFPVRTEGFAAFQKWVQDHKGEHSSVEIGESDDNGYGLRATRDIQKGEKVLVIPETIMMTSATACIGPLGRLVACDRMLQVMPNVTLALHLLNERYKPDSYWKPYIDILPPTFTTPLYFNRQELDLLQGSPCLSEALQQTRSIAKLYGHLHKLIRTHADVSLPLYTVGFYYDDFVWAVSCVMSRQNDIPLKDGNKTTMALIPLWDMCNHTLTQMGTDFNVDGRTCECYATYDVRKGEEFKIFYGARSNAELFIHQGFAYPPHDGDSLKIKLGLSSGENSSTKAMKTQLLKKLGLPVSGTFYLLAESCCPFSAQLRVFVRIFTADVPELERYLSLEDAKLRQELVSLRWRNTDVKALHFLEKRAELLLQTYKTAFQLDYELLARKDISDCARQAVTLTLAEKCILAHAQMVASHTRQTLEHAAASGADIVVEMTMSEEEEEEEEGEEEKEEDEEEKVDGFSDQCAETTCKTRGEGGGSADSKQPGSTAEVAIEKAEEGKEKGGEVGEKTVNSCKNVEDRGVGSFEVTDLKLSDNSSQLQEEAGLEGRGQMDEQKSGENGEAPTQASREPLVTMATDNEVDHPGSVSEELCTQTDPASQNMTHHATHP